MTRKLLPCLLFCFSALSVIAQTNPFMTDGNGRPLYMRTNYVADGSPYLSEEYKVAQITSSTGKVYADVRVRVNFIESQIEYMTDDGQEMIALLPIQKIKFSSFKTEERLSLNFTLESIDGPINGTGSRIYQVLDSGKMKLLKEIRISYKDEKKYGEATITRVFKKTESLFALSSKQPATLLKIEKNKAFLLEVFKDRLKEINAFIDVNKLKCRSNEDILTVFSYYNSLAVK